MTAYEMALPRIQAVRDRDDEELLDYIAENAPAEYLKEFRKAGVRLGHA